MSKVIQFNSPVLDTYTVRSKHVKNLVIDYDRGLVIYRQDGMLVHVPFGNVAWIGESNEELA